MPAATPCKLQRDKYRETCRTVEEHKTKYACIVEADESMRTRSVQEIRVKLMKPRGLKCGQQVYTRF